MQVSLKWIDELVGIKAINLDDLIDKLTLGGFEVEEILRRKIDNENQLIEYNFQNLINYQLQLDQS